MRLKNKPVIKEYPMRLLLGAALLLASIVPAWSAALPKPESQVVLTVTGQIEGSAPIKFDMPMLDALPQHETTTITPWYDGERTFKGPLGSAVLEAAGAEGSVVHVRAINDYSADIPVTEFKQMPVIFATTIDGERMSVRDKGPLFIIYPFDLDPSLYNEAVFGRSVWQVVSLEVR